MQAASVQAQTRVHTGTSTATPNRRPHPSGPGQPANAHARTWGQRNGPIGVWEALLGL